MAELGIRELTKVYGENGNEIVAVDDLNITVADGEMLILVGPSGCGKSTTLRSIAGLETVTEGHIVLDGVDVTDQEAKDRDMAMVFQNYALYPHMTARENMSFGLRMGTDMSKSDIEQRVEETAEMMGIKDLLDKKPGELSGGQQQRVALGRAIVRQPQAFLMDEPLSNLDAKLRDQMRTELQTLQQQLGITTVYVTHDQTEAMTMGDRIAILNGGELQQVGSPLECYHRPANRFVAGFIGSPGMNFFDAQRRTLSGEVVLEHEEFEYVLTEAAAADIDEVRSDSLVIGIRPEDIRVVDEPTRNSITINVDVIEPLGDVNHVIFSVGGTSYTATLEGDYPVSVGDELELLFPEGKIHIFDSETGEALKHREMDDDRNVRRQEPATAPATRTGEPSEGH
jgi:multiple sugar transport system ATP-binding protein